MWFWKTFGKYLTSVIQVLSKRMEKILSYTLHTDKDMKMLIFIVNVIAVAIANENVVGMGYWPRHIISQVLSIRMDKIFSDQHLTCFRELVRHEVQIRYLRSDRHAPSILRSKMVPISRNISTASIRGPRYHHCICFSLLECFCTDRNKKLCRIYKYWLLES